MFGLLLPSRPVLTPAVLQTISPTQYAYSFPSSPHFSHVVIFLIPGNDLPAGACAAVYIQFPGSPDFKLLGAIAMDKQSAIFQVNNNRSDQGLTDGPAEVDMDADLANGNSLPGNVIVGVSLEPIETVSAQLATLKASSNSSSTALTIVRRPPSTKVLAQRIIRNAFNFLASFVGGEGGNEVVPLKSFQEWWKKFERRVEIDPGFLEREGDG
ncbi:hypothetical protein MMC34_002736 [Xylographa carneopallida]|nr:hypothetical protein [Xylographa carneopallida]